MQHPTQIIDKLSAQTRRMRRLVGPLLRLSPAELTPDWEPARTRLSPVDVYRKIEKLHDCCGLLEFRPGKYNPDNDPEGDGPKLKLHNATYCKQYRFCPKCSNRTQQQRAAKFKKPFAELLAQGAIPYHVIFTVSAGRELDERYRTLIKSIRTFVRQGRRRGNGKKSRGEWSKVLGGVVGIEAKRGETKLIDGEWVGGSHLWHVHAHAILFCSELLDFEIYNPEKVREIRKENGIKPGTKIPEEMLFPAVKNLVPWTNPATGARKLVPASKISIEWMKATGGNAIDIEVKRLGGADVEKKIFEVLKYQAKYKEENREDLAYMMQTTSDKRFFFTYEKLRGLGKDEYELSETKESKEIFLSQWSDESGYSPLVPSEKSIEQLSWDVKRVILSKAGKLLGEMRRLQSALRREYLTAKIKDLGEFEKRHDHIGKVWRKMIGALYSHSARMDSQLRPPLPMPHYSRSSLPNAELLYLAL